MDKIKALQVWWEGRQVGTLALTSDGLCAFEYTKTFLAEGTAISPFELPLRSGVFTARRTPFDGGFGVFDDSLPDGWGMLLLERMLQKRGVNPLDLSLLDLLSVVGKTGRGALEFRPEQSISSKAEASLKEIAASVENVLSFEDYQGKGLELLYRKGGSPGGARPKVSISYKGSEWLVKFPAKYDNADIGRTEYRYSKLARTCGIEMPETKLFEGRYFGVKRFDRTSEGKLHVISMAGLVCTDYRSPSIDYQHIFQACQAITHNMQELWKVYRLMAFNYLIKNKDDHAKNFAFIFRDSEWHFAPAFDLLPSYGLAGYHTTSINNHIDPKDEDLIAVASNMGLKKSRAIAILDEMRQVCESYV